MLPASHPAPSARSPPHKSYEPFAPPPEPNGRKQSQLPGAGPSLPQVGQGLCSGWHEGGVVREASSCRPSHHPVQLQSWRSQRNFPTMTSSR